MFKYLTNFSFLTYFTSSDDKNFSKSASSYSFKLYGNTCLNNSLKTSQNIRSKTPEKSSLYKTQEKSVSPKPRETKQKKFVTPEIENNIKQLIHDYYSDFIFQIIQREVQAQLHNQFSIIFDKYTDLIKQFNELNMNYKELEHKYNNLNYEKNQLQQQYNIAIAKNLALYSHQQIEKDSMLNSNTSLN